MADNTSLVRRELESSLTSSNLKSLVDDMGYTMLLIDTSGSMAARIMKNSEAGERRIDALRKVVADVKSTGGGWPMIAFGGDYDAQVRFVDDVPEPAGGTPLHMALQLAREYGATRVVIVSDGEPMLPYECIEQAKQLGRCDVIFVGGDGDSGFMFLEELAKATGGQRFQGDLSEVKQLSAKIIGLLTGEVAPPVVREGPGFSAVESDDDDLDEDEDPEEDDEDEEKDDDEDAE